MISFSPRAAARAWRGVSARVVLLVGAGLGAGLGVSASHAAEDYLDPDQAFVLSAERRADGAVALHWRIAEGYSLYQQRLHLRLDGKEVSPRLPGAESKRDAGSGETLAVYHHGLDIALPAPAAGRLLDIEYQGCADSGLCYSPLHRFVRIAAGAASPLTLLEESPVTPPTGSVDAQASLAPTATTTVATSATARGAAEPAVGDSGDDAGSHAGRVLRAGNLLEVVGTFLLFGLLLSLTPCVLPMVPILSSIVVGQQVTTRRRGLQLALAYSMGMALVYTALGVAAGLAGEGLAGYLQQPAVLVGFALLLAVLSLSMFDVYTLQVPSALQTRLAAVSDRLGGGAMGGAAAVGALSAAMIGPCVAAPLAGALLYIGQSHDVLLGGLALFALACGMSVPLLLAGASAGSLLPRAGAWMNRVKHVFGLVLLAVAWWMVTPLTSPSAQLAVWGLLAIAAALFLGLYDPLPAAAGPGPRALRTVVIALAVLGVLELVGSASGADDPLAPLAHLAQHRNPPGGAEPAAPRFASVASSVELDRILAQPGRPVMLDFYADWCVSCKEMERGTFKDPQVMQSLQKFTLVRADVTANSAQHRDLLKRFGLFGPPGLVFFDAMGREVSAARLIGFAAAPAFHQRLRQLVQP